jgi:hypothetical protein
MNPKPSATRPQSTAADPNLRFWDALHRRTCDRIAWPEGRAWLLNWAHLAPGHDQGWPVLRLVLAKAPPLSEGPLLDNYRAALTNFSSRTSSPLLDLARSLVLEVSQ